MINLSKKNKEIADSRWKVKIGKEKNNILDNDEARILKSMLCGFLAGDGSVQVRKEKTFFHYQLDFYPDDNLMKDVYVEALEKVYRKKTICKKSQ